MGFPVCHDNLTIRVQHYMMMYRSCMLVLLYPGIVSLTLPGFKTKITQRGFDYANDLGIEVLHQSLSRSTLSDLHGESGVLSYDIKNFIVKEFPKPQSSIQINPDSTGLIWRASGIRLSIHADWEARLKKGWVDVSDDDSLDATIGETSFMLSVSIDSVGDGHPKVSPIGCSCTIDRLDLQINGGSGWVYEFFINIFKDKIKEYFQRFICNVLQRTINENAQRFLSELPVTVDIDNKYTLDYRWISNPNFTPLYMETYHKGHVYWANNNEEAPFTVPDSLNFDEDSSKMLYLYISGSMLNSLLYQAHIHDVLNYRINKKELPDGYKGVLSSSCSGFNCIGIVIPQISERFPDKDIELNMKTTDSPTLTFQSSGIGAHIKGVIEVFAVTVDGSAELPPVHLMTINTVISTKVTLSLQNDKLFAKVGSLTFKVSASNSTVGNIDNEMLQFLIDSAIKVYLEPKLNDIGKTGFPLPTSRNIKFINTELVTGTNSLLIATDVEFVPDGKIVNESERKKDEL